MAREYVLPSLVLVLGRQQGIVLVVLLSLQLEATSFVSWTGHLRLVGRDLVDQSLVYDSLL